MSSFLLKPVSRPIPAAPEAAEQKQAASAAPSQPAAARVAIEEKEDSSSASPPEVPRTVDKCHAFLSVFNSNKPTTVSTFSEEIYVVIGRGPAATTNLATLKKNVDRIVGKKLVVIGKDDPWAHYVRHNMNQEVELLTLPGFMNQPEMRAAGNTPRWMDSWTFANITRTEFVEVTEPTGKPWTSLQSLPNSVLKIDLLPGSPEIYEITLEGGDKIRASHVDVCTGTGQQAYVPESGNYGVEMCPTLRAEYMHPQPVVKGQRFPRIWSAEMFVVGDCQVVKNDAAILIASASSPAGLQAGEHALNMDRGTGARTAKEVLLVASRTMNEGFLPIGRLDDLARTHNAALPTRLTTALGKLYPTQPKMWFGEYYRVVKISILDETLRLQYTYSDNTPIDSTAVADGKLLVTFKKTARNADEKARLVPGSPFNAPVAELAEELIAGLFDQVVISTGRARGGTVTKKGENSAAQNEEEPGSAMQLVWSMHKSLVPIDIGGYEFSVGLKSPSGTLRMLGAAGINNPIFKASARYKAFQDFEQSLPVQARVNGEGITLATLTVAIANEYFSVNSQQANRCINTATRKELLQYLNQQLAEKIFFARHDRVRPFQSSEELLRALISSQNVDELEEKDRIELMNNYELLLRDPRIKEYEKMFPDYSTNFIRDNDFDEMSKKMKMRYSVAGQQNDE